MWLSRKKHRIDQLYEIATTIINTINENIEDPSLHIDAEYFFLAKKRLGDVKNSLEKNDFKECLTLCEEAQDAVTKELNIITLLNETKAHVNEKKPGSLHAEAVSHQKEAISFIKKGLLEEARKEIQEAKKAAEPTLVFIFEKEKHTITRIIDAYKRGQYNDSLQDFIDEKSRLLQLRETAEKQQDTLVHNHILTSMSEVDGYIQDIKNILQGEIYENEGDTDKALSSYQASVMSNPHSVGGLLHLADLYNNLSEYKKAADYYSKVLEQDSQNKNILYKKALALFNNGEKDLAFSTCSECLAIDPKYPPAQELKQQLVHQLNESAELLMADKKFEDAIHLYDRIINIDPANVMILSRKADAYREMQDIDAALRNYILALTNKTEYYPAKKSVEQIINSLFIQAEKLREQKQYKEAIHLYDRVLQHVPTETRCWYAKALCLESLGELKPAVKSISKAIELQPDSLEFLQRKTSYLMHLQQYNEALEIIENLLKHEPSNIGSYILKSSLLWKIGKINEALKCIHTVLKKNPKNKDLQNVQEKMLTELKHEVQDSFTQKDFPRIQYQFDILLKNDKQSLLDLMKREADQSFKENDFRKAYFQLNAIHDIAPSDIDVQYKLSLTLVFFKEYEKALHFLDKIPQQHKAAQTQKRDIISFLFEKAQNYEKNKIFHEAVSNYNIIISYDPTNGLAYKEKGRCLQKLEKKEDAVSCYTSAIEFLPDDVELSELLGSLLFQLKRYTEALVHLTKYLETNETDADGWYIKGVSHDHLKQNTKALASYTKAIKINPEVANYWTAKAKILDNLDKNDEALECYERAIKINPENDTLWNNKGYVLNKLCRYHDAIAAYEKAQELSPKDEIIQQNIEQLAQNVIQPCVKLFKSKQYQESLGLCDFILKHIDENEEILRVKAYASFETQKYRQAISAFNRLLKLNPTTEEDWFTASKVYVEIQEFEKAIDCLNMVLKLNESNIDASIEKNILKGRLKIQKDNEKFIQEANQWYAYKDYTRALKTINKSFVNSPDEKTVIALRTKILSKIAKDNVTESKKHVSEGDRFFAAGDYKAAVESYQLSSDLNPSDTSIKMKLEDVQRYIRNAETQNNVEQTNEQELDIDNAAGIAISKMSEKDEYSLIIKGVSFFKIKMYQQAIDCFNKAIKKNPENAIAYYNKGLVLEDRKRYNNAHQCYEKACRIDPAYIEAKIARDKILSTLKEIFTK